MGWVTGLGMSMAWLGMILWLAEALLAPPTWRRGRFWIAIDACGCALAFAGLAAIWVSRFCAIGCHEPQPRPTPQVEPPPVVHQAMTVEYRVEHDARCGWMMTPDGWSEYCPDVGAGLIADVE